MNWKPALYDSDPHVNAILNIAAALHRLADVAEETGDAAIRKLDEFDYSKIIDDERGAMGEQPLVTLPGSATSPVDSNG